MELLWPNIIYMSHCCSTHPTCTRVHRARRGVLSELVQSHLVGRTPHQGGTTLGQHFGSSENCRIRGGRRGLNPGPLPMLGILHLSLDP